MKNHEIPDHLGAVVLVNEVPRAHSKELRVKLAKGLLTLHQCDVWSKQDAIVGKISEDAIQVAGPHQGFMSRHDGLDLANRVNRDRNQTPLPKCRFQIRPSIADRLRLILGRLNAAADPRDLSLPGLDLHELQGARKRTWAVRVSGNWRVAFSFTDKEAERVDYEDDH